MSAAPRVPNLNRDLAWIAGGILAAVALVGAAVGAAVDWLIHHHRGTL